MCVQETDRKKHRVYFLQALLINIMNNFFSKSNSSLIVETRLRPCALTLYTIKV